MSNTTPDTPAIGCLQVYTGNGKGKSTAAFGLALRATGAGFKVFVGQFVKGMHCSEVDAFARFGDLITLRRYGRGRFIKGKPVPEDIEAARQGLIEVRQALASGDYRVVILDEGNIATHYELFSVDELLDAIAGRAPGVEVVVTGRNAHPRLIEAADLVTEMREIKHYYHKGIPARKGIEC